MTSAPYASRERSTKERILGAAEALFATHGFAGASLRQVTAAARVNLAAVNYHFGSKDKLIEEVFRRRLDELNSRRLAALGKVAGLDETRLEDVLDAYIRPALDLSRIDGGGAAFAELLQWGRGAFGAELAANDPGSAYAAWSSGEMDVYVQRVGDPRRASVRLVYKQRQLRDGSEL